MEAPASERPETAAPTQAAGGGGAELDAGLNDLLAAIPDGAVVEVSNSASLGPAAATAGASAAAPVAGS